MCALRRSDPTSAPPSPPWDFDFDRKYALEERDRIDGLMARVHAVNPIIPDGTNEEQIRAIMRQCGLGWLDARDARVELEIEKRREQSRHARAST